MQWTASEHRVRSSLREPLKPCDSLAAATHRLVTAAIATCMEGRTRPPGQAAEVQARILVGLSHDLRVVQLAATRSYSLQALSIAANIFELSNAIAYIGTDSERAKAWETQQDTQKTYPPLSARREAIRATLPAAVPDIGNIERRIDRQEKLYSTFCMAKHGNPKALRRFGIVLTNTTMRLYHGPFVTEYVTRQARFTLYHSARMVAVAAIIFSKPLLLGAVPQRRRRYNRIERDVVARIIKLAPRMPGGGM
jgi:hypothetical protein